MRVTTIDRYDPAPGTVVRWALDTTRSSPSDVPPSFNQGFHLAGAIGQSVWLAVSFDVDGPLDRRALSRAYTELIARHGTLRSTFRRVDGVVQRQLYSRRGIGLGGTTDTVCATAEDTREVVRRAMNTHCRPFGDPSYVLAAIDRADRSTVLCGFDHAHVDAYSVAVIAAELDDLYTAYRADPDSRIAEVLPAVASFVDYCAMEATADPVDRDDPRMQEWLTFLRDNDCTPPTFGLDMGVRAGDTAPQAIDMRQLLDGPTTEAFEAVCRAAGASVFAGVLGAMARSVGTLTGSAEMPVLVPMHTRREPLWRNAVGWFTTNAPVTITAARDSGALGRNGADLRDALRLGAVPITEVVAALGGLDRVRNDVFMVSYVDYRTMQGARDHRSANVHHISNTTTADDAQFWISRTDDGLALRTRYPDTAIADGNIARFLCQLTAEMDALVTSAESVTAP